MKGLFSTTVLASLTASTVTAQVQNDSYKHLNVLYIMADDLNSDMGSFDDPLVQTPNLDRLRANALRFTGAYCQFPLSGPSRASIMTGYYPEKTRVYDLQTDFRENIPAAVTLPELFKINGYYTARVGKIYHAGVPFDIGGPGLDDAQSWQTTYNPIGIDKTEEHKVHILTPDLVGPKRRIGGSLAYLVTDGPDDLHTDAIGANIAASLIRQHKDEPFFIATGFYRPHTPYVAPRKYFDLYPMEKIQLPYVPKNDWDDKPAAACNTKVRNYNLPSDSLRKAKQAYYAAISFMDAQIGKLLDVLEETGLADKTIIVFQSDHGYHMGDHNLWQKQTLFEHCANTPLIISVPGLTKGRQSTGEIVEFVDIYPTIAEVCQLENVPTNLSGRSFLPLLQNTASQSGKTAYTMLKRLKYPEGWTLEKRLAPVSGITGRSIRTSRYRYTEWDEGKLGGELYDYQNDPNEFKNLYNNPVYKSLQDSLRSILYEKYRHGECS